MKGTSPLTLFIFACSVGAGVIVGIALRAWGLSSNPDNASSLINKGSVGRIQSTNTTVVPGRHSRSRDLENALSKIPRAQRYLWLAAQTEKASLAEMERLFRLAGIEGHTDLQRAIATRWARLDPEHMFQTLKSDSVYRYRIVRILFDQWAQSDPEKALELVVANKRNQHYRDWGIALWSELMKHAPEIGIAGHDQIGIVGYTPDIKRIGSWAKSDPQAAAELVASKLKSQNAGWNTMKEIAKVWGESDPEAALAFGLQLKDRNYRYTMLVNSMKAWVQKDPLAATTFVDDQSDVRVRAALGRGLVAGLAKTDPEAALTWADENLKSSARSNAASEAVMAIAKKDLHSAAELVAHMEPGGTTNHAVSQIINEWSEKGVTDNDAMWNWIESLSDREARERAVEGLEWRLQLDTRDGLIDLVAGEHGHLATRSMVQRAARQKARQDPQSAVQWAEALPEGRSDTALKAVMVYWRGVSPDDARAWEMAQER